MLLVKLMHLIFPIIRSWNFFLPRATLSLFVCLFVWYPPMVPRAVKAHRSH